MKKLLVFAVAAIIATVGLLVAIGHNLASNGWGDE